MWFEQAWNSTLSGQIQQEKNWSIVCSPISHLKPNWKQQQIRHQSVTLFTLTYVTWEILHADVTSPAKRTTINQSSRDCQTLLPSENILNAHWSQYHLNRSRSVPCRNPSLCSPCSSVIISLRKNENTKISFVLLVWFWNRKTKALTKHWLKQPGFFLHVLSLCSLVWSYLRLLLLFVRESKSKKKTRKCISCENACESWKLRILAKEKGDKA